MVSPQHSRQGPGLQSRTILPNKQVIEFSGMRRFCMALHTFPLRSFKVKGAAASVSFVLLVLFALLLSACGNNTSNNGGSKVLKAIANTNSTYTESHSPFASNPNDGTFLVYEPMVFVDAINGQETPMLATGHQFNSDNT